MPGPRIACAPTGGFIRRATSALLVPILTVGLAGLASAQGVQYTTVTQVSLPGALGSMMQFAARMGGSNGKATETTYLTPTKRRTDNGAESEIMDLDGGRLINIDHRKKQYYVMTFEEMKKAMEAAAQQASAVVSQGGEGQTQASKSGEPQSQVHAQASFKVEPTGRHEKILGHDAAETYVTAGLDMEATQHNQQTGQDSTAKGNLTMFNDMWMAKGLPIANIQKQFDRNMAEKLGSTFTAADVASIGHAMRQAYADPRVSAAMKQMAAEGKKLQGTPLRTVMYLVTVPDGQKFDPKLAMNEGKSAKKPKKKSGGFGSFLKAAMKAEQQNQQQDQQSQKSQQAQQTPPHQVTIVKSTTNMTEIKVGSIPASVFEPPAGYKKVPPPDMGGGS